MVHLPHCQKSSVCLYCSPRMASSLSLPRRRTPRPVPRPQQENLALGYWSASRTPEGGGAASPLPPGAQRPWSRANVVLAGKILRDCGANLVTQLWHLHPKQTILLVFLNLLRGAFPAWKGYSHAQLIDEFQTVLFSKEQDWSALSYLVMVELFRRIFEGFVDSILENLESQVTTSAKFFIERKQLEQRLRMDIPTMADPVSHDLIEESDLFVRSFHNMGGFGLLSPFDFVHFLAQILELGSHIWILLVLTQRTPHFGALGLSLLSTLLPFLLSWLQTDHHDIREPIDYHGNRAVQQQERMRRLAHSDVHKPEVILFGLAPWIMRSWSSARASTLRRERPSIDCSPQALLSRLNMGDMIFVLQNIPLIFVMESSTATLGSFTLFRSTIQACCFSAGRLMTTARMTLHSVFLMAAFCAAMELQPKLSPSESERSPYRVTNGGVEIKIRDLSYTYPGSPEPALKNVNLDIGAGETVAIVGYNGSGKTTLAKMILRLLDFDSGRMLINGTDISSLEPREYHRHVTTVLQGFSKYNAVVNENVGIGDVSKLESRPSIEKALELAGALNLVQGLPRGLDTLLDSGGFEVMNPYFNNGAHAIQHGLSGGEWQRVALARAFLRAAMPDVDLLLLDEATSSLDAQAQKDVLDNIDRISRGSNGSKTKTIIFITHRLSIARRAHKIAMMEKGTVVEFGTHDELMRRNGPYASLCRASEC